MRLRLVGRPEVVVRPRPSIKIQPPRRESGTFPIPDEERRFGGPEKLRAEVLDAFREARRYRT